MGTTVTLTGTPVSATEGLNFSGKVASFTDTNSSSTASEFSASIKWGDGVTTTGTVAGSQSTGYTVSGTHTYSEENSYTMTISITDTGNFANDLTINSPATVGDATISASCGTPPVSTQSFNGQVALLTDANPGATPADYTVTINWGDATSSPGTVSGTTQPFSVTGSHTYAATGIYTVTAMITDDGGSTASTSGCSVVVFAFAPGGGSFVIGDGNSATGTSVNFWGPQWRHTNTLSGGSAPAAFKGFAENPTTPTCGISWSTDPGNSTPPPEGPLPSYMGVIVTSSTTKSGSTISGDTPHVVVVATNSGYQPNVGHPGTGVVVAQVC
jgi:hypothetical protein